MLKNIWSGAGENFSQCAQVRTEVFVKEQGYPVELEFDSLDKNCPHLTVFDNDRPIATGRIVSMDRQTAKLGRIAVLKEYRGRNIGAKVMEDLIKRAKEDGFKFMKISAQTYAVPFYEKFGFKAYGDEYPDVHIPHIDMIATI